MGRKRFEPSVSMAKLFRSDAIHDPDLLELSFGFGSVEPADVGDADIELQQCLPLFGITGNGCQRTPILLKNHGAAFRNPVFV